MWWDHGIWVALLGCLSQSLSQLYDEFVELSFDGKASKLGLVIPLQYMIISRPPGSRQTNQDTWKFWWYGYFVLKSKSLNFPKI